MAFKLKESNLGNGSEQIAIPYLATYIYFETLTPPVTEAAMRAAMEANQFEAYTDLGWFAFMTQMGSIAFEDTSLTPAQRAIQNTIIEVIQPQESAKFCTRGGDLPAKSDGLTSTEGHLRTGSVTFEHEIRLLLDKSLTCDIVQVKITLTPDGGAPAVTSSNPFIVNFDKGSDDGLQSIYSILWVTFAATPSGKSYGVEFDYLDSDALSIATYVADDKLNL